jgi:hypothetical protein
MMFRLLSLLFRSPPPANEDAPSGVRDVPVPIDVRRLRRALGPGRPSRQKPPRIPGLYRIVSKDTGEILYIGKAQNLLRRMNEHLWAKKYQPKEHYFEWQPATRDGSEEDLYKHEKKKIEEHKPVLNGKAGGGGKRATRLGPCPPRP